MNCSECHRPIRVMCYLGTGVCSGMCEKARRVRSVEVRSLTPEKLRNLADYQEAVDGA